MIEEIRRYDHDQYVLAQIKQPEIVSGKEEKDPDLSFFELEIELAGGGREAHLDEADRIILEKFGEG